MPANIVLAYHSLEDFQIHPKEKKTLSHLILPLSAQSSLFSLSRICLVCVYRVGNSLRFCRWSSRWYILRC